MGLWVAAAAARFARVLELDLSGPTTLTFSSKTLTADCKITDSMLVLLRLFDHGGNLQRLTSLNVHTCDKITEVGLEHVDPLTQLTSLNLGHIVTDTGLEHVAQITQLTSLNLGHIVTDTGLVHVAQLTQLATLDVGGCDKIADTGLEHVARLT